MAKSRSEQLREAGATPGDWPEPSTYAPNGYSFTTTGDMRSRTHLTAIGEMNARCGVGTPNGLGSEQSLDSILDEKLCDRCLREAKKLAPAPETTGRCQAVLPGRAHPHDLGHRCNQPAGHLGRHHCICGAGWS